MSERTFRKCPACGEYDFAATHRCPPLWFATMEPDAEEEDWCEVYARDAEQAAERFAAEFDRDCLDWHRWDREDERTVWVRRRGEEPSAYAVEMEVRPHYTATEARG